MQIIDITQDGLAPKKVVDELIYLLINNTFCRLCMTYCSTRIVTDSQAQRISYSNGTLKFTDTTGGAPAEAVGPRVGADRKLKRGRWRFSGSRLKQRSYWLASGDVSPRGGITHLVFLPRALVSACLCGVPASEVGFGPLRRAIAVGLTTGTRSCLKNGKAHKLLKHRPPQARPTT